MNKESVLERLEEAGFKAYLVGGCLRDEIMGQPSSDVDIATSARPDDVKEVFKDFTLVDIGKKFGTIKVISGAEEYEITTLRSDSIYLDKRRPVGVAFTDDIYEDLARRDFTINAMAQRSGEIIDPFDGRTDIKNKIIRAVGDPKQRIEEDYLRALRAVRFATCLDFTIEESLKKAIKEKQANLEFISKERITSEINKILLADDPVYGIRLLEELDLLDKIFPELARTIGFDQHSPHHYLDVYEHSLEVLKNTDKDLITRLAAIFHDVGKVDCFFLDEKGKGRFFGHQDLSADLAINRLKALKYSKKTIESVEILIRRHMDAANTYTEKSIKRLLRRLGKEDILRLLDLQKADKLATVHKDLANINKAHDLLKNLEKEDLVLKRSDLAINGKDLIKLGYKEGRALGDLLKLIEENVLEEKLPNNKEKILEFIREMG